MKENSIDQPQKAIDKLASFLPDATKEKELKDYPPVIHAWTALQFMNQSPLRYHKSEDLGEFIYNADMYTIKVDTDKISYLNYNTSFTGEIELPEGCVSTNRMFYKCDIPEGITLGDKFDTSNVTDMSYMFLSCKLPKGFTLGDKFDTSNVTNMNSMFSHCKLPEGFTLGDKFDTSNVTDMTGMLCSCKFPEGFTLGDKFNTSKVTRMVSMFSKCKFSEGFTLGDKFDISNVECMLSMFYRTKLPDGTSTIGMSEEEIIEKLRSNS